MSDTTDSTRVDIPVEEVADANAGVDASSSKKRSHEEIDPATTEGEVNESASELGDSKDDDELETKRKKSDSDSPTEQLKTSRENTAELIAGIGDDIPNNVNIEGLPNELPDSDDEAEDEKNEKEKSEALTSDTLSSAESSESKHENDNENETKADETENKTEEKKDDTEETETKTEEKDSEKQEAAETATDDATSEEKKEAPTSLFSAGTTFKGGFGSFAASSFTSTTTTNTSSLFGSSNTTSEKTETPSSTSSAFSSPSLFKGGFSSFAATTFPSTLKKDNPWAEKSDEKNESKEEGSENGGSLGSTNSSDKPDLYAQVASPLEEKKIETGEESEESVFTCRVKLYALDVSNYSEGWKERGVGVLHVNTVKKEYEDKYENKTKSRAVMRADGILKVILNVPLNKSTEVMTGMKSSLASEKFVRITAFEDGKPFQYSLRTGSAATAQQLFDTLKERIPTA